MQKIIILDFGSQTTQLIGRRVRELDTFCEIMPYNKFPQDDPSVIALPPPPELMTPISSAIFPPPC